MDGWEDFFEVLPVLLQPGGELQVLAKVVGCLVHGEAGWVGGDLEEDPAGLAEVDRATVVAVEDGGDVEAAGVQLLPPSLLRLVVRRPPSDVMYRPDRGLAGGPSRQGYDVREATAGAGREVPRPALALAGLFEAQEVGEDVLGNLCRPLRERHAGDAADGVFGRYRASFPDLSVGGGGSGDELDREPV